MRNQFFLGLSLSPAGEPVLARLLEAGVVQALAPASLSTAAFLEQHWTMCSGFVAVGACGAITRLVAPRLSDKRTDPAVVVVDPEGRFAVPLLGGHAAGAEALCQRVAALLDGQAVLTGASSGRGRLALDAFGAAWGWRKGHGDWDTLMRAAAADQPFRLHQDSGTLRWRGLEAARPLRMEEAAGPPPGLDAANSRQAPSLVISHRRGEGCRWHPPVLWLGLGCERHTSLSLLKRMVEQTLAGLGLAPEAVAGITSVDIKRDEPALLALAAERHWPLRFFSPGELAPVDVPTPSPVVERELGTSSVAEAAALLAAGPGATLLAVKRIERAGAVERGAATLAVGKAKEQWAPSQGHLHLVGSGPGRLDLLTPEARRALAESSLWVGYGLYLDLLEPLRRADQQRCDGQLTQERERCRLALDLASQGITVALISSGDSGIYGMAGLALELWLQRARDARPGFTVHPGLSALQLAAARAGAPLMHDFCTISLSDRLTPWATIEQRLMAAASGDFVVALYNPRSLGRDWQLGRARELLLQARSAATPVVLARQLGRSEEQVSMHRLGSLPLEQVDMLTLVLVGNSTTRLEDGWVVTPRGYPGAELG